MRHLAVLILCLFVPTDPPCPRVVFPDDPLPVPTLNQVGYGVEQISMSAFVAAGWPTPPMDDLLAAIDVEGLFVGSQYQVGVFCCGQPIGGYVPRNSDDDRDVIGTVPHRAIHLVQAGLYLWGNGQWVLLDSESVYKSCPGH